MSTPDQPGSPPLTRRQMREIRNTGATPIIGPDGPVDPEATDQPASVVETSEPVAPAPLPRAAEPAVVSDAPVSDASVDLGVSPLTRRQARQQERIRTASVPVITPDVVAAHSATAGPIDAVPVTRPADPAEVIEDKPTVEAAAEAEAANEADETSPFQELFSDDAAVVSAPSDIVVVDAQPDDAIVQADEADSDDAGVSIEEAPALVDELDDAVDEGDRAVVSAALGADLLAGEPTAITLPPTFDQLLTHSTSGSTATPNALIVSQTTGASTLVGPVAATGEVLITGTFNLPEGLGSLGHAPGTADGKDVDAVLVDGELPAHSSPTPIAASAAISTVKTSGEIIKPPVPEKGNKLMISLAITAGALAAALLAVLAIALISGVF